MIKIIYTQPAYMYEHVGGQEYNIETTMELNSDISATEAILAFTSAFAAWCWVCV